MIWVALLSKMNVSLPTYLPTYLCLADLIKVVDHVCAEDDVDDDVAALLPLTGRQVDEHVALVLHQHLHACMYICLVVWLYVVYGRVGYLVQDGCVHVLQWTLVVIGEGERMLGLD